MNKKFPLTLTSLVLGLAYTGGASGQLFGPRTLGRPLSRQTRPSLSQQVTSGTLQGNERFLRGNRSAADFVGGDSRDVQGFVGMEQATTRRRVRTAVEGLRERRSVRTSLNQPRGPLRTGEIYSQLAFSAILAAPGAVAPGAPVSAVELSRRLTDSLARYGEAQIEVWVAGRTALLRGTVASERQRELAKTMVLFEPGISRVQNELVLPAAPAPPPTLLPPTPAGQPARP